MIPELIIRYDHQLRPISAECISCGQHMPKPPSDLNDDSKIILWFSERFVEHRKEKHPAPPYYSKPAT